VTVTLPGPSLTTPTWLDPTVGDQALATMHLKADDPDAEVVKAGVAVAAQLVDTYVGVGSMPTREPDGEGRALAPEPVQTAVLIVGVEMYRRRDAAFGVLNAFAQSDFGPVRISTDWLKGVESILRPYMRDHLGVG
jgi:hypothetical protein